jgi:hypothetical protein
MFFSWVSYFAGLCYVLLDTSLFQSGGYRMGCLECADFVRQGTFVCSLTDR